MIVLDYQDRRSIYEQVTDKFQILILNGVLPPGSQMPSVRQLATELFRSPISINTWSMAWISPKALLQFLISIMIRPPFQRFPQAFSPVPLC